MLCKEKILQEITFFFLKLCYDYWIIHIVSLGCESTICPFDDSKYYITHSLLSFLFLMLKSTTVTGHNRFREIHLLCVWPEQNTTI